MVKTTTTEKQPAKKEAETKVESKTLKEKKVSKKVDTTTSTKVAVILVRGLVGVRAGIKDTLLLMRLTRKNNCVVLENNAITRGMLQKVKDYVTWGEIDDATYTKLIKERGEEYKGRTQDSKGKYTYNRFIELDGKNYKKMIKLNPPKKGFGRKGIKVPFSMGGALGKRGVKINDLIERML
jgi:large subunit ribosomal protein L30